MDGWIRGFRLVGLAGNSGSLVSSISQIFFGFTRLYQALPGLMSEGRLRGLHRYMVAWQRVNWADG